MAGSACRRMGPCSNQGWVAHGGARGWALHMLGLRMRVGTMERPGMGGTWGCRCMALRACKPGIPALGFIRLRASWHGMAAPRRSWARSMRVCAHVRGVTSSTRCEADDKARVTSQGRRGVLLAWIGGGVQSEVRLRWMAGYFVLSSAGTGSESIAI
jgi:hypothetical protein